MKVHYRNCVVNLNFGNISLNPGHGLIKFLLEFLREGGGPVSQRCFEVSPFDGRFQAEKTLLGQLDRIGPLVVLVDSRFRNSPEAEIHLRRRSEW